MRCARQVWNGHLGCSASSPCVSLCFPLRYRNRIKIPYEIPPCLSCAQKGFRDYQLRVLFFERRLFFSVRAVALLSSCLKEACQPRIFLSLCQPKKCGLYFLVQDKNFPCTKKNKDWSSHPIWQFVSNALENPIKSFKTTPTVHLKGKKNPD